MKIIRNSIITPDGTTLVSQHRHDFVCHVDKNGKKYCVDGGKEYLRRIGNADDWKDTSVTTKDKHSLIRNVFTWGTYGKDGKQPFEHKLLKDLDTDHIEAIIKTQTHLSTEIIDVFKNELKYGNS